MDKKVRQSLVTMPVSVVLVLWYNNGVKGNAKTTQEEQK
nr:MAG TPA: hypothetical protein [Caudoviricetes sp.]DAY74209.1 MAG TPA: hypothetical protein [Caudoviricetes sp.]